MRWSEKKVKTMQIEGVATEMTSARQLICSQKKEGVRFVFTECMCITIASDKATRKSQESEQHLQDNEVRFSCNVSTS